VIKEYINKITIKEFIKFNNLSYAAQVLIIKKFEERLKIYIDYRILNTLTIKNRNISLLIKETLSRLYKIKYYSKFDVIAAFNKIKIKKENKKRRLPNKIQSF